MHVMFSSACEKRALSRTRAVLDGYARRTGPRSWLAPMTEEGLEAVRTALRRTASKLTAVACYRNDGRSRMRLLWTVGNGATFSLAGDYPVATKTVPRERVYPEWLKDVHLLATTGGYCHDLGKYNLPFQQKLRLPEPVADEARHEWISAKLIPALRRGVAWDEAWAKLGDMRDIGVLAKPITGGLGTVGYLAATHHRLPFESEQGTGCCDIVCGNHVRNVDAEPAMAAALPLPLMKKIRRKLELVDNLPSRSPEYWRAAATLARAALIFADHVVSARNMTGKPGFAAADAHANTCAAKDGSRVLNQPLPWHLEQVGEAAGKYAEEMAFFAPDGLSPGAIAALDSPAQGRFGWQNKAATALRQAADQEKPTLVLNMAGTGTGKTRMNARALVALSAGRPVRIAAGYNLRTLTMQSGDAYQALLGTGAGEIAVVTGDAIARKLHKVGKAGQEYEDEDGNPGEPDYEVEGSSDPLPDWLQPLIRAKPKQAAVIGAPLLVATADYLVNAGEPNRQGHHVLALLRLMSSDLVLDEIDSYDIKPLAAMLRLVQLSAFFGRNVVVSSATLPLPVAKAVYAMFESGLAMRSALHERTVTGAVALLDDKADPVVADMTTAPAFEAMYNTQVKTMLSLLSGTPRVPVLKKIDLSEKVPGWEKAIAESVKTLHDDNHFVDPLTGKRVSIGVVRVANIRGAIPLARSLSRLEPRCRAACYHSQHFLMQRWHLERRLDYLLTRKGDNPNARILQDPEIRALLNSHPHGDLILVVVATPVEEIGRDHDFDFAVIEPSSMASLIQMVGRVLRHRLESREKPNVAILQFNRKAVEGKHPCFTRPGLEGSESGERYLPPQGTGEPGDMAWLLNWVQLPKIDASARFFGLHPLAAFDDRNTELRLAEPLARMLGAGRYPNAWMSDKTYRGWALRESDGRVDVGWRYDPDVDQFEQLDWNSQQWVQRNLGSEKQRSAGDLFVLTPEEMAVMADKYGISRDKALSVAVKSTKNQNLDLSWDHSFGFIY